MVGGAAAPFEEEEGGVVAGDPASLALQRLGELPCHLRNAGGGRAGVLDARRSVRSLAELLAADAVLLDQAVGEAQHPVAALDDAWSLTCGSSPPKPTGNVVGLSSLPDDLVVADQQRLRGGPR